MSASSTSFGQWRNPQSFQHYWLESSLMEETFSADPVRRRRRGGGGVLPSKRLLGMVPLDGGRIFTTGLAIMGVTFLVELQ